MSLRFFIIFILFLIRQAFSQSVSVDFSTAQISPPTLPGYSGTITVDAHHKIHFLCTDNNSSSIVLAPCQIVNGTLLLKKHIWSPLLTHSAALYFDPPATSVSGITNGVIGPSVLYSFNQIALYADNTQIFFKQNPPALFSYPFSYVTPSGISFLSLTGLFPQTAGAAIGDPNAYYYLGLSSITWTTQANNFDLSLGEISISPTAIELDKQLSVTPDKELQIQVPIAGTGISSTENRVVPVYIVIGSKYYQQNIALSELASGGKILSFTVTIPIDEVGDKTIYAVVDPANTLNEAQRLNNISSRFVHILCKVSDKGADVPWFYQSQSPWGKDDYANLAPTKMKKLGCLVTSLSMMLNTYGIKMSSHNTSLDPGALNQGLKETLFPELGPKYSSYNGYSLTGDVQPNGLVAYARNAYFIECVKNTGNVDSCLAESKRRISFKGSSNVFNETTRSLINKELCQGNPVILRVPSITQPNNLAKAHFVLATGMTVDEDGKAMYITNDPGKAADGENFKRNANSTEIRGYRLYRPTDDPSMVFFHLSGDVTMLITDPQGRRAGYDPLTRQTYNDIPGGTYISPESISDPEDPNISTEEESRFEGLNPLAGQYQVQIFANSSTNYQLTQYSFDTTGTINGINNYSGSLEANESLVYSMEHSDQALPIRIASLDITRALFIDTHYKDMALISGKIKTSDGEVLSSKIEKYLQIKVGSFFKSIDKNQLKKTRHPNGGISYFYGSLGQKGLYIHITPQTGEFNLLIHHAEIDTGDIDLTTDVMIQVDDVIAKGLVSFKSIRKNKKHEK